MTPERFGELLRRPRLLDGQNAVELEELVAAHPWCGPLRVLRYRKAVLDDAPDAGQWRARAEPYLSRATLAADERRLRRTNPARAETHFGFGEPAGDPDAGESRDSRHASSTFSLSECILSAAAGVDVAEWHLHRNGLIMELGRPRPAPIEHLDSYKRWKRRRMRTSWEELLVLGTDPPKRKGPKPKPSKGKTSKTPTDVLEPEVASETLADLLAGQGHVEKATRMYEQLSLRYPHKSASFDARIRALQPQAEH